MIPASQAGVARYAKAIGHPVHMYILELLFSQSCCYSGDLSEIIPIAKSTLSQHFYECESCHTLLEPQQRDCCVFCSYGSVKCPPEQRRSGLV